MDKMCDQMCANDFNLTLWTELLERTISDEPYWVIIFVAVFLFVIFLVSFVGNLMTCIVIASDKSMHTVTNFYLFNLAVSDFIVSFAILLQIQTLLTINYAYSDLFCKIHFFFVVALWNNSILIMTALAIERYIAVWHPMVVKSSGDLHRVRKVMVVIWGIVLLETLPEIWTVTMVRTETFAICFTVPSRQSQVWNGIIAVFTFVVPLTIMTVVYAMIAFKVNTTDKAARSGEIFNQRDNRGRVNKLIALSGSFLVCWLPFFTLRVLICAFNVRQLADMAKWWNLALKVVMVNCWFSSVLNPVLFSLMSTKFRDALKNLWSTKKRNQQIPSRSRTRVSEVSYDQTNF